MVNIAYFSNQFSSTQGHGIARYSWELYRALSKLGYQNHLYPVSSWSDLAKEELHKIQRETNLQLLPTGRLGTIFSWSVLQNPPIEWLMKHKVDVVHAVSLGHPVPTRKKLIYTAHDIGPLTHPEFFSHNRPWIMRNAVLHAAKHAHSIACVSEYTANEIIKYCKSEFKQNVSQKIRIVYEGVASNFNTENKEQNRLKVQDLLGNSTPYILGVGKLSPRKNFKSVLRAFNQIKHKIVHNLIIVGGNGWDFEEIEKVIQEYALQTRVKFLGYVTDDSLVPLYQNASVFVYPSKFEGFGLTILEAMACGCPVITSNISSMPEVAGESAVLVNPNSDSELAEAILYVCNNEARAKEMEISGLKRSKEFTWEKCASQTIEMYENN